MSRWQPLLEQVAHERYPRLVAYASLLAGSRAEAEDLVQDALVATFSSRARFTTLPEAEAYVRRSVASRAIDRGRRRTVERAALRVVAGRPGPPPPSPDAGIVGEDVLAALGRLAPRERACVVLRYMDDLSLRDTARTLGLSEGAVKRYTSDGVARLNAELGTEASTHVPVETQEKEVRRA